MATIDQLVVQISADTKELKNAFIKSEKVVNSSSEKIKKSSDLISNGMNKIKLASIAATASIVLMGKSMISEIDRLQKLSIRLGESTENLSRLKFVSQQSGVSFKTTAMALQRMQRRVAEAAKGTGEAKDALKELGISAEELNKLTIYEQFLVITKSMESLKGASDRTRLAMKLFDSQGVALTQIMDQGAISVKKLADETPNIVTQETANNIAEFNDNMNVLSQNIQRYVLPVLSNLAKVANSLFEGSRRNKLENQIQELEAKIRNINNEISLMSDNTSRLVGDQTKLNDLVVGGTIKQNDLIEKKNELIKKQSELIKQLNGEQSNLNGSKKSSDANKSELSQSIVMNKEEIIQLRKESKKTADSIKKSMNNSTDSWSRNLSDAIIDSKGGFQSLADFASNVLRDIASQVVQSQIASPIVKSATDIFTGQSGSQPAPNIPSQTTAPVVQPTARIQSYGNGQNITINQTIQPLTGIDDSQVRAVVASQAPAIAEQAKISTLDAISRGGRARQVIRGV